MLNYIMLKKVTDDTIKNIMFCSVSVHLKIKRILHGAIDTRLCTCTYECIPPKHKQTRAPAANRARANKHILVSNHTRTLTPIMFTKKCTCVHIPRMHTLIRLNRGPHEPSCTPARASWLAKMGTTMHLIVNRNPAGDHVKTDVSTYGAWQKETAIVCKVSVIIL